METFTRSETYTSTASICLLQLLATSKSSVVSGGICWVSLGNFREVSVPMFKYTLGQWALVLWDLDDSLAVPGLSSSLAIHFYLLLRL